MLRCLNKLLTFLSLSLIFVSGGCIFAMMLHVFADVVAKYVINFPIPGTAEIAAEYYMVAAVFLPLPYVEIRNSGIAVDLFYDLSPPKGQYVMSIFAYICQILFFSFLTYQTSLDALHALEIRDFVSGQVQVTVWPAAFFLSFGFGLAMLVSILRLIEVSIRPYWPEKVYTYQHIQKDVP